MKIPFFSLDLVDHELKHKWKEAISNVINSESVISGESVAKFESEFAAYIGAEFAISTSNGLDGLILSLRAAGISSGDLVAVPAHTFIATHLAVLHVGATPFSIDVDNHGLLNLELLKSTKAKFKAVIPVHMHGAMVDMNRLLIWARSEGVIVIEDASQSHGCEKDGVRAGQKGDMAVFSLYPTKNLGALGDAGVVLTSNPLFSSKLKSLRNYGSSPNSKYEHREIGYNNRLDTLQAAVLRINLVELDVWNSKRQVLAKIYEKNLKDLPLEFLVNSRNPAVYHHFPILTEKRNALQSHLLDCGIATEIHYPNLASTEIRNMTGIDSGAMVQGESIARTTLSLPLSQWHSEEQIEYVSKSISEFFEANHED